MDQYWDGGEEVDPMTKKAFDYLFEESIKDSEQGSPTGPTLKVINVNDLSGSPQTCPLEEVPKYLNDDLAWNRAYARARLELGE